MKAYYQLTIAQLRIFARNRSVIFFSLVFPILLMVALGTFLGNGAGVRLSAIVLDQDQTSASAEFLKAIQAQSLLGAELGEDQGKALDALKKGDYQLVVVIPAGYEQSITTLQQASEISPHTTAQIKVYYDETNMTLSELGLNLVQTVADQVSKELTNYTPWVTVQPEGIQAVHLQYIDFLVPGIVAMMIMSNNLNGVAGQIAAWRERGILRRMQSTTLRASTFIAAQITSRLLVNGIQAILVLLIGNLFFQTQVNGSWLLLILFVVLGTLTFMSIGFIIAGLAKNPESAGPIAGFVSFPLLFLGGVFFPIKNMPELLQPFVKLLPITHLSGSLRQVMNVGADLTTLWPDAALLAGWMVVAFVIASLSFKWE